MIAASSASSVVVAWSWACIDKSAPLPAKATLGRDFRIGDLSQIVLSLYGAAFYAEIFRGGIESIERGQWDAARALGLSRATLHRKLDRLTGVETTLK